MPMRLPRASRGKRPTFSVLELCAGAGGQAVGFEAAGFAHVALVDKDPHSCATLRINRPYWNVIEADLNEFDTRNWHGVDVVAAGLPCPPFSIAGQQLGSEDDRDLFPALLRIVAETEPRAVIVENVRGLLTRRFEIYRSHIIAELQKIGFFTHWQLLDAVHYGAPQNRRRSFLVALRTPNSFSWPSGKAEPVTVGEALEDMMGSNGWRNAGKWAKKANRPGPTLVGGSRKHGGPDLGPTRARKQWAELGVDGLGIADSPPERDFEGMPRLTIPMTAKLQTFPDRWQFMGNKTQRYRQIGNALPSVMAAAVAEQVAQCLAR